MSFFSEHKKDIFFITRDFNKKIISKSNIILSPEFYWAKKVSLNVSFAYEVKKMAPSLFDGILPHGDFEYSVFKLNKNDYIVTAYDMTSIKEKLKQLKIDMDLIEKIYLAQSEFFGNDISIRVNETCGMTSLDNIMIFTCLNFIDSDVHMDDVIKTKKLTQNHIYSKQNIKIAPKQITLLLWIVFLLNFIVILDIVKLHKSNNKIQFQKENFIKDHSLPQTSFQLKSIQNELQIIDKKQVDLRESIYYASKFKLDKTEYFESIIFSKNSLNYKLKTKNRKKEFEKYLSKKDNSSIVIGASL